MTNRAYRKGYQFELRVKRYLEKKGYYVVRSAKSHGLFDLIAIKPNVVFGIQCRVDGRISKAERSEMQKLRETHKIVPLIAYRVKKSLKIEDVDGNAIEL